jgi:hypothetical protein
MRVSQLRYFLSEPRTQILGWVLSRREREVTRDEYDALARRFTDTSQDWYEFWDYATGVKGRMEPKP